MYAPDPENDLMVRGEEVLFCTSGEAVSVLDYETQKFRPTKLTDLYDAARLGDQLDHIHTFGQPFIAAEYSGDVFVHDMSTLPMPNSPAPTSLFPSALLSSST